MSRSKKNKDDIEIADRVSTLSIRARYALDAYWVNRHKKESMVKTTTYSLSLEVDELYKYEQKAESQKVLDAYRWFKLPSVQAYLSLLEKQDDAKYKKIKDDLLNITNIEGKDYNTVIREIEAKRQLAEETNNMTLWQSMTDMLLKYKKASKETDMSEEDRVHFYLPQRCCDCPLYIEKLNSLTEEEIDKLVKND